MGQYPNNAKTLPGPASVHFTITPHDTNRLVVIPRALYCQAAGNVVLVDEAGTSMTYTLTQGQVLPFRPVIVKATGTTATVIGWE